jgi:hypothetical protein
MNLPPPLPAPQLPLPQWAYVPGEMDEADADHDTLWQAKVLVPSRFRDYVPARHPALRYGLALNDRGYFWEAQEILEAVWAAAPQGGRERILLRACIQIANANLRLRIGKLTAAVRRGAARTRRARNPQGQCRRPRFCGRVCDGSAGGPAAGQTGAAGAVQSRLGSDRRHRPDMKQNSIF